MSYNTLTVIPHFINDLLVRAVFELACQQEDFPQFAGFVSVPNQVLHLVQPVLFEPQWDFLFLQHSVPQLLVRECVFGFLKGLSQQWV